VLEAADGWACALEHWLDCSAMNLVQIQNCSGEKASRLWSGNRTRQFGGDVGERTQCCQGARPTISSPPN